MMRCTMLALGLLIAAPVAAGENPAQNSNTFRPTPFGTGLLGVPTTHLPAHLQFVGRGWLAWNHMPVKVTDEPTGAQVALVRR
jgi:hypothetical protein